METKMETTTEKNKLHLKSAGIGFIVGVLSVLIIGFAIYKIKTIE